MLITQSKDLVKNCARAEMPVPILMVGSMGIGKSQIIEQVANELAIEIGGLDPNTDLSDPRNQEKFREVFGFVDLRLATQEPADLIGYPYTEDRVSKLTKKPYKVLRHAQPEWFPEEGTRGVIFLDELNRAPTDVRQAVFQLVKERRLHTHKLPKGWFIVAAINPDNGNYQVESLDKAMIRRFCCIKVGTNPEIWLRWAHGAGVDENITGFVSAHDDLLVKSEDFTIEGEPTPDQYAMLSMYWKAKVIPRGLEAEVARGLIGSTASVAFTKWCDENYSKPVSGRQVLDEFEKHKAKLSKQKTDEWAVTLQEVSAELWSNDKPTKKRVENLCAFILFAPVEIKTTIMSKLPGNYLGEVMNSREVTRSIHTVLQKAKDL